MEIVNWKLTAAGLLLFSPLFAAAYTDVNLSGTMLADVSPQNPAPGGTVTIRLTSYATDLNRSNISWESSDKIFKAGFGERTISVRVGPSGTETRIRITASTPEGDTLVKELVFLPAGIDLLWQAHTTVPFYYKGRALPTGGSSVTILAEPDFVSTSGAKLDASTLVYEWKRNGNKLDDASGYGKYTLEIRDTSSLSDETISVTATDLKGTMAGESTVSIPNLQPRIAVYEEDPLKGTLFEKALKDAFDMIPQELSLRGVPYFYPSATAPSYWTVNSAPAPTNGQGANVLTVRQPENQQGTAQITYAVPSSDLYSQTLQKSIKINFGGEQIKF